MKSFGISKNEENGAIKLYRSKIPLNPFNPEDKYESTFEIDHAEMNILVGFLHSDERYKHLFTNALEKHETHK